MNKKTPETIAAGKQLQELVDQGKVESLWKNGSDCARKLGMSASTLHTHVSGYAPMRSIERTTQLVQNKLQGGAGSPVQADNENPLLALFEQGRALKLWRDKTACAKAAEISRCTLKTLLSGNPDDFPPRRRQFYDKVVKRLKRKIDAKQGSIPTPVPVPAPPPRAESGAMDLNAVLRTLIAEAFMTPEVLQKIADAIRVGGQETHVTTRVTDSPPGVIASPWFDRILAGTAELKDQNRNGIRFVLTRNNFASLHGIKTKQEIEDTKLLIEELRRRLNFVAQLSDKELRRVCYQKLARELDELYCAYRLVQEQNPLLAADEVDRIREFFGNITRNS